MYAWWRLSLLSSEWQPVMSRVEPQLDGDGTREKRTTGVGPRITGLTVVPNGLTLEQVVEYLPPKPPPDTVE